ncbi:hypothetical protein [Lutibacter sp. B1]|uniref:hypothetical protein n=1 Tax=Lutibacter sp. B1 TaxID=2725996 RepID=UPI0014567DE5|nr:hypothetical protein [Lutibacter sp. B1]NLP59433.1 hypothetical protein [Lutibacter sp. B1]
MILTINVICSCKSYKGTLNSNETIEISSWSRCGDKGGRFHLLKIKQDSTIMISGTRSSSDTLKNKTELAKWKKMTELLNVEDFLKFDSGQIGNLQSDGCISGMSIKTKDSVYNKAGVIFNKPIEDSKTINDLIIKTSR